MATGPVKHVVLFKFKDGLDEATINEMVAGYKALPGKIDHMKAFEWGADVSVEGLTQGFTHCFIVTFDDVAGRAEYLPHPAHQEFVEHVGPNLDKILVPDFVPEVVK